jgi:hypothetical protein
MHTLLDTIEKWRKALASAERRSDCFILPGVKAAEPAGLGKALLLLLVYAEVVLEPAEELPQLSIDVVPSTVSKMFISVQRKPHQFSPTGCGEQLVKRATSPI